MGERSSGTSRREAYQSAGRGVAAESCLLHWSARPGWSGRRLPEERALARQGRAWSRRSRWMRREGFSCFEGQPRTCLEPTDSNRRSTISCCPHLSPPGVPTRSAELQEWVQTTEKAPASCADTARGSSVRALRPLGSTCFPVFAPTGIWLRRFRPTGAVGFAVLVLGGNSLRDFRPQGQFASQRATPIRAVHGAVARDRGLDAGSNGPLQLLEIAPLRRWHGGCSGGPRLANPSRTSRPQ